MPEPGESLRGDSPAEEEDEDPYRPRKISYRPIRVAILELFKACDRKKDGITLAGAENIASSLTGCCWHNCHRQCSRRHHITDICTTEFLSPADIREGRLEEFDVLAVPGGKAAEVPELRLVFIFIFLFCVLVPLQCQLYCCFLLRSSQELSVPRAG